MIKLSPFELEVKNHCKTLFPDSAVVTNNPFPEIKLKGDLYLQIIQLNKLTPDLALKYFQDKSIAYQALGKQLLFLWEDHWVSKGNIVKSRLNSFASKSNKIYGRKTNCTRIDKKTYINFLNENHLQTPVNAKLKYGLFLDEQLVAVAGFTAPRKFFRENKETRSSELVRFCNLINYTVIGGFDKTLKYFIAENEVNDIMSYADCDWSNGHSYERLNFEKTGTIPPTEYWIHQKEMNRIHTSHSKKMLGTDIDQEIISKGYQKIVNSGSIKYIKFLSKN